MAAEKRKIDLEKPEREPEEEHPPAFLPQRQSFAYRASADERAAFAMKGKSFVTMKRELEVEVCRSDGGAAVVVEAPYTVEVKQLAYPGWPDDAADPAGKWVYAFLDGALVLEAQAMPAGLWEGWTVEGGTRRPWRSAAGIPLDPGPSGRRHTYRLLLSAVRLSAAAIEDLRRRGAVETAGVACACDGFGKVVLVPEPIEWAAEAYLKYLEPRLATLRWWQFDEQVLCRKAVAEAMKGWSDGEDPANVKDYLEIKPTTWLEGYAKALEKEARRCEEAAAYLAECLDTDGFKAAECSARDAGGADLELVAACLALTTTGAAATATGRMMAARLAQDPERIPGHFIFQDKRPPLTGWFSLCRDGLTAFRGIAENTLPAIRDLFEVQGEKQKALDTIEKKVQRYLENVAIETKLHPKQERVLGNLRQDQAPDAGAPSKRSAQRARKEWRRLEALVQASPPPTEGAANAAKWEAKYQKPVARYLRGFTGSVGAVVEVANLVLVVRAMVEPGSGKATGASDLLKALADATGTAAGLLEAYRFGKEGVARTGCRAVGGVAGVVSGVFEMIGAAEQLSDAQGQYDHGRAAGEAVHLFGGAAAVIGGGLVLASVIEGGALGATLGPVGALVGVFAALLIIGGQALAYALAQTVQQTFANRCFLGNDRSKPPASLTWTDLELPSRGDARVDLEALYMLMAQFKVRYEDGAAGARLVIQPGLGDDTVEFFVAMERHWQNQPPSTYLLHVALAEREVRQVGGPKLRPRHFMLPDEGPVQEVWLAFDEVEPKRWVNAGGHARVRLHRGPRAVPKDKLERSGREHTLAALRVDFTPGLEVHSLAEDRWVAWYEVPARSAGG